MSLKLRVFVSDIATVYASYDRVQLGRAATQADASSQAGTFTNLGSVITLTSTAESYSYIDRDGAVGQWYVSRYFNSATSAAGAWSDPFQGAVMGYISAAEFRDYDLTDLTDIDGTALTDDQLDRHIATASRLLDGYLNGLSFALRQDTERHRWHWDTRRIYPYQRPIVSADALKVFVAPQQTATFSLTDIYVNTQASYIEVANLSTVTYSLFPVLAQFGLMEPVAELTYTHGYQVIPQDVKDATALTTAEVLGDRALNKQGMAGLSHARIGEYQINRKTSGPGLVLGLDVPAAAKGLVDHYLRISLA